VAATQSHQRTPCWSVYVEAVQRDSELGLGRPCAGRPPSASLTPAQLTDGAGLLYLVAHRGVVRTARLRPRLPDGGLNHPGRAQEVEDWGCSLA